MPELSSLQSKLSIIKEMRQVSPEREEAFGSFLKEREKSNLDELTTQDAMELIDRLKKVVVYNILDGSYILTTGFDLSGLHEKGRENFKWKDIMSVFNSGQTNPPLIKFEKFPIGQFGQQVDVNELRVQWVRAYGPIIERADQEYIMKSKSVDCDFDDLLVRILNRKLSIFRQRGYSGTAEIELVNLKNVTFYYVKDPDDVSRKNLKLTPQGCPESEYEINRKALQHEKFRGNLRIYVTVYLITDADKKNESKGIDEWTVGPAATATIVLDPVINNQESGNLGNFFMKARNFLIQPDCSKDIDFPLIKESENEYLKAHQVISEESDGTNINIYPLEIFLYQILWRKFVGPLREYVWKKYIKKGFKFNEKKLWKERYLDPGKFIESLHNLRTHLQWGVTVLKFKDIDPSIARNPELFSAPSEFRQIILGALSFPKGSYTDNILLGMDQEFVARNVEFAGDGTYLFRDRAVAVTTEKEAPEPSKKNGELDITEPGLGWWRAWFVVLSSYLCFNAQIFYIYNKRLERHISGKEGISKLLEMTKSALTDLRDYYDADAVTNWTYRLVAEKAKKHFGLNTYFDILTKNIDLYSSLEASHSQNLISKLIASFTVLAFILLVVHYYPLSYVYSMPLLDFEIVILISILYLVLTKKVKITWIKKR